MANLQRQVNVQPTAASYQSQASNINPEANLLNDLAPVVDQVRSFVADQKKDKLTEELRALGDDVFAVNTGKEVKRATDRFKRLRQAKDQGALTDTMVKLEAEAILKEEIDSMPAFGPELRRHAASLLGYDPTGAQIRALMDMPKEDEPEGNTVLDKMRQTAEAISATTGANVDDIMKLQGRAMYASQQADLLAQQAAIGNAGRKEILNAAAREADGHISAFMGDLVTNIRAGGVTSPAEVTAELNARVLGHKQALRDRYAAAGISPDASQLSQDMALIDEQWSPTMELAKDGSLSNILSDNVKALTSAMTIEGFNVMGDVALINQVAGQEGVRHYFLTMDKYGKKEQMDLLITSNPVLARNVQSQGDAVKLASEAYKTIMGQAPVFSDNEALKAMTDRVFYDVVKNNNATPEEKEKRLDFAKQSGQKFKVIGGYMQAGARSAASPDEVRFVTQTFEEEYPRLVERVAAEVTAEGNWKVKVDGGKLVAYDPKSGMSRGLGSQFFATEAVNVSASAKADLVRLNAFNTGIANGWAYDLKREPKTFLDETAKAINDAITGKEVRTMTNTEEEVVE